MKDFVIYTDSTADLSLELIEEMGIKIVPFEFTIREKAYLDYPDRRELSIKDFYNLVREGHQATTSLVNVERFLEIFEPELQAGNDVLYIVFSSGLTGSVSCAMTAMQILNEKYPDNKFIVIDSLAASMGQGLLAYLAVQQKRSGKSMEEVAAWVEDNRNNLCHWFTVDDLGHLRRGGRVSAAAAILGSMLNIKPVLHVDNEGHLIPMQKVRGRQASLLALADKIGKTAIDPQNQTIFISHGDCLEDCKWLASEIKRQYGVKQIYLNYIGPVIGAHAGPGTVALFFYGSAK